MIVSKTKVVDFTLCGPSPDLRTELLTTARELTSVYYFTKKSKQTVDRI